MRDAETPRGALLGQNHRLLHDTKLLLHCWARVETLGRPWRRRPEDKPRELGPMCRAKLPCRAGVAVWVGRKKTSTFSLGKGRGGGSHPGGGWLLQAHIRNELKSPLEGTIQGRSGRVSSQWTVATASHCEHESTEPHCQLCSPEEPDAHIITGGVSNDPWKDI